MTKELVRKYNLEWDDESFWGPLIEYIKKDDNLQKFFIAFRTQPGRISIYYKGREAVSLIPKAKKWMIKPRKGSSTKIEDSSKSKTSLEYVEKLKSHGFHLNQQKMSKEIDYIPMLEDAKWFLDEYYKNAEEEKTIQNDIACRYQSWHTTANGATLLCVDQEYNQCFENTNAKESSKIKGRYDLTMLEKRKDEYKLIFVELKSNESACISPSSGIIDHVSDIDEFFEQYESDAYDAKTIMKNGTLFALERKKKFGLIAEEITEEMIDFDHPEFWLLFDMTKKHENIEPHSKKDLEDLIDAEIARAKHVKETYFSPKRSNVDNYEKGILGHKISIGPRKVAKSDLSIEEIEFVKASVFEKKSFYGDFVEINME